MPTDIAEGYTTGRYWTGSMQQGQALVFVALVLTFLILAWIIFIMVKAVNNMRRRLEREKPAPAAAPPPADVALLTEIRDLLAKRA